MNSTLTYSPSNVTAAAGDFVQFQFAAGNHTATQSNFDNPCTPISQHSNMTGFHSGFQPVAASASSGQVPTFTIQINNTSPLWVYCAQGKHCEAGMVMVINENTAANSTRSLANFKSLAAGATTVVPGTSTTGSNSSSSSGGTSSTTSGVSSTSSTAASFGNALTAPGALGLLAMVAAAFAL
jgi:plastocyanin